MALKRRKSYEHEDGTRDELKALTVRFKKKTYEIIRDLSVEYNMPMAEVTRRAAETNLQDYFSQIRYLNHEDAEAVNKNIDHMAKAFHAAIFQLKKIGANYDQELYLKNLQRKISAYDKEIQACGVGETSRLMQLLDEQAALRKKKAEMEAQIDAQGLDVNVISKLITQLTEATEKCGDELCRIRGLQGQNLEGNH